MTASWIRTVDPVLEPISIEDAKAQARISDGRSNSLLDSYIRAGREEAEAALGRGLYTQTWALTLGAFYNVMYLPMAAPLQSVTSIQYYDDNGALQTLSTSYYDVDTSSRPGRVTRKSNQVWPSLVADRPAGRVIITYVVGWTDVELIPERIKQGIRFWVTYLDADRTGMEIASKQARDAAAACWTDRVEWIEPSCSREN